MRYLHSRLTRHKCAGHTSATRRRRHTPDQTIHKLAEGNKFLASGQELDRVCRHLKIAKSKRHRWVARNGGIEANDAKHPKELEGENGRLKKLLADAELDEVLLREIASGDF